MESSATADSALTALRTSRTRMMLCNANGTNKHRRWFWLGFDKDSATVHWSKSETGAAVKGKHAHSNVLLHCYLSILFGDNDCLYGCTVDCICLSTAYLRTYMPSMTHQVPRSQHRHTWLCNVQLIWLATYRGLRDSYSNTAGRTVVGISRRSGLGLTIHTTLGSDDVVVVAGDAATCNRWMTGTGERQTNESCCT